MKEIRTYIRIDNGTEVMASAPVIVSASRATDIPAFYAEWFFYRLEAGYCIWRNPFNGKDTYVSFKNTRFIIFWSKNPAPLIPYLKKLKSKGINCYIQYTLNDYENELIEPGLPSLQERIETFKLLVKHLGKGHVIWRYDPLLLSDKIDIPTLLTKIERIGDSLSTYTDKMVFSFADISNYSKVKRNLRRAGICYKEWSEELMNSFSSQLAQLNHERGWNYKLATCAEKIDLALYGISHNRCIDDELIVQLSYHDKQLMEYLGIKIRTIESSIFGDTELPIGSIPINEKLYAIRGKAYKDKGQRQLCGCIESKDIGRYDTCPHACRYCYANSNEQIARINHSNHNPKSETI